MRKTVRLCALAVCALAIGSAPAAFGNNVQAKREGGLLKVTGDNAANQIVIAHQGNNLVITGMNGTTVNGQAFVQFANFIPNAADVRMRGGNDVVTLNNLTIAVDLFIDLGAGADRLRTGALPSSIGVKMTVEGGLGNDVVELAGLVTGEDLYINGHAGRLTATLTGLSIGKAMTIIGDGSNDVISVAQTTTAGATSIESKAGSDQVSLVDFFAYALSITTDLGHDSVHLENVWTLEDLQLNAGAGHDVASLVDVTSGKNITVTMDVGDDTVLGTNVFAEYDAVFEGGDGNDSILDDGIDGGEKKEIKEFEIFL